jgi:hypothetical protein
MVTELDIPKILKTVREELERKGRERALELRLEERDYRLEDDWLYLCVTPANQGIRPFEYAEILGEIEKDLREQGNDNVLLVPSLAD